MWLLPHLGILINSAVSMGVQIALWDGDLFSFGYRTRNGISGSNGSSVFNFLGTAILFFMLHHENGLTNLCSHQQCKEFSFLYILVNPAVSCFNNSHSNRYEVLSHCCLDLHFPMWWWASFHAFTGHLYVFFGEMSIQVVCPF